MRKKLTTMPSNLTPISRMKIKPFFCSLNEKIKPAECKLVELHSGGLMFSSLIDYFLFPIAHGIYLLKIGMKAQDPRKTTNNSMILYII